jgi:hypothetical protein
MPCRVEFRVAAVLLLLSAAASAAAQRRPAPALDAVEALACTFPVAVAGSWKAGQPKADVLAQPTPLSVDIESINIDEGSALIGDRHLTAVLTESTLHVMERSMSGSLTLITVLSQPGADGTFRAVRSRHDYLKLSIPGFSSEPTISQHYGSCVVRP